MTEAAEEALGDDIRSLASEVRHLRVGYRRSRIWNVILGAALVVGVVAGVIGEVGQHTSSIASSKAAKATVCLNRVLSDRNGPTARDNAAQRAYVQASNEFNAALVAVLGAPKDQQAAEYRKFLTVLDQFTAQSAATDRALRDDQAQRARTPLGNC